MLIQVPKHSRKRKKRIARGESSGWGCSAGRGIKGQKSRTGGGAYAGHEGGQLPMYRKLPKARGFGAFIVREERGSVTLGSLAKVFPAKSEVTLALLKEKKLVAQDVVQAKVLVRGKLEHALTIKGIGASKAAKQAIEAAGGSIQ